MDLKALLNKCVTVDREAKAAGDEQLFQGRDPVCSTAMNKINPDLETGQSTSPARTEVDGGVTAKLAAPGSCPFCRGQETLLPRVLAACSGLHSAGCPASHITLGKAKGGSGNGQTQPHSGHRRTEAGAEVHVY